MRVSKGKILNRAVAAPTGQWKVGTAKTREGRLEGHLESLDGRKKKENSNVATPRSDA